MRESIVSALGVRAYPLKPAASIPAIGYDRIHCLSSRPATSNGLELEQARRAWLHRCRLLANSGHIL